MLPVDGKIVKEIVPIYKSITNILFIFIARGNGKISVLISWGPWCWSQLSCYFTHMWAWGNPLASPNLRTSSVLVGSVVPSVVSDPTASDFTWECIRKANSQDPLRTTESEMLVGNLCLSNLPATLIHTKAGEFGVSWSPMFHSAVCDSNYRGSPLTPQHQN